MKKLYLILLAVMVLSGCKTCDEPSAAKNTLFVGNVSTNIKNNGIEFIAVNDKTQERTSMAVKGLFYTNRLSEGDYTIEKIVIRYYNALKETTTTYTITMPIYFSIDSNVVNNLGIVRIEINEDDSYTITLSPKYDDVRAEFEKSYNTSAWNSYNWLDVYGSF